MLQTSLGFGTIISEYILSPVQVKAIMDTNPEFPYDFIDKVIISKDDIQKRVQDLGRQIAIDYKDSEKLLLLGFCAAAWSLLPT
jgi:hypothetical protein